MEKSLKRYGQNYLTDRNIIRKIIEELEPRETDTILEIGPGRGALTEEILKYNSDLTVIELDKRNCSFLSSKFNGLKIIEGDFLEFDLKNFSQQKIKIIGNIPYNITTPIIMKLMENAQHIESSVLMMQKEAALRFNAKQGSKDYGISNILINYFSEYRICFSVKRSSFIPRPNVDSAIVNFKFNEFNRLVGDQLFIQVVKASFRNRRKNLKNSLQNSIFATYNFNACEVDMSKRAEVLQIEDFVNLAKFIKESDEQ